MNTAVRIRTAVVALVVLGIVEIFAHVYSFITESGAQSSMMQIVTAIFFLALAYFVTRRNKYAYWLTLIACAISLVASYYVFTAFSFCYASPETLFGTCRNLLLGTITGISALAVIALLFPTQNVRQAFK